MKHSVFRIGSVICLALALAACSSTPRLSDAERVALYREHAGEPVKDFRYTGSLSGWTPLSDRALAVWARPSQAYLLELTNACTDLQYAPAISLSNLMGQVSARFDNVYVHGGMNNPMRMACRIDSIRPLDVKALRQAEKELRQADTIAREQDGS